MICDNCGEAFDERENEITCPICGVLQNIAQTQTDYFSGFYTQSQRLGRLPEVDTVSDDRKKRPSERVVDAREEKDLKQRFELKNREICIILGLQEILISLCKVLVINYGLVHLLEANCRDLWKVYLSHYFSMVPKDAVDGAEGSDGAVGGTGSEGEDKILKFRVRKLESEGVNVVVGIILLSLNRYRYGVVCADLYRLIVLGRVPLKGVNKLLSRQIVSKLYKTFSYLGPKGKTSTSFQQDFCTNFFTNCMHPKSVNELKKSLSLLVDLFFKDKAGSGPNGVRKGVPGTREEYELDMGVFSRRIVNHLRLPALILILIDRLIAFFRFYAKTNAFSSGTAADEEITENPRKLDKKIYGSLFGFPNNLISSAIVLVSCRLLWPVFHTQPPCFSHSPGDSGASNGREKGAELENFGTLGRKKVRSRLIVRNTKKIFRDFENNAWVLEAGVGTDGQVCSRVSKIGADTGDLYSYGAVKDKIREFANISRYGYNKSYLRVLYYYYHRFRSNPKVRDLLMAELVRLTDFEVLKRHIIRSFKRNDFKSLVSSVVFRYIKNHFLAFKVYSFLLTADGNEDPRIKGGEEERLYLNLIGSSSCSMYSNLLAFFSMKTLHGPMGALGRCEKTGELISDNLISNSEIFYILSNLYRNCPNFSGFSPEKSLEINYFILSSFDQRSQILKMAKEINFVETIRQFQSTYNNVVNNLLNYLDHADSGLTGAPLVVYGNKRASANAPVGGKKKRRRFSEYDSVDDINDAASERLCQDKVDVFDNEMKRIESLFQDLGKITQVGSTLPSKPYNTSKKSYQGLPVSYLIALKAISNFVGVAHFEIHNCVIKLEAFLVEHFNV